VRRALLSPGGAGLCRRGSGRDSETACRRCSKRSRRTGRRGDEARRRVLRDYPNFRSRTWCAATCCWRARGRCWTFGNVVQDGAAGPHRGPARRGAGAPAGDALAPLRGPAAALRAAASSGQKHVLVVDSRRSRLYVFGNDQGRPRLVADFYVTLGKNGVEKIREGRPEDAHRRLPCHRNLPRRQAPPTSTARALPINYPKRMGPPADARARHLAARRARPTSTAPAARERRLPGLRQPDSNRAAATCRSGRRRSSSPTQSNGRCRVGGRRAPLSQRCARQWRANGRAATRALPRDYSQRFGAGGGQGYAAWPRQARGETPPRLDQGRAVARGDVRYPREATSWW